jgi:ketosteroid isomerase-like protein
MRIDAGTAQLEPFTNQWKTSLAASYSAESGPRHARLTPKAAVGDTQRTMPQEPKTPDLVELWRRAIEVSSRRDFDGILSFFAPDSVWDMSPMGMGTFEGLEAIRGFYEDWMGAYTDYRVEAEEILDLGNGVAVAVLVQKGRPADSRGEVRLRYAAVATWVEGSVVRVTNYTDIDEARAAAERLAEERG